MTSAIVWSLVDRLVDEADRALLPDGERRHRRREDDRSRAAAGSAASPSPRSVSSASAPRPRSFARSLHELRTRTGPGVRCRSGRAIVSMPCSYVASAADRVESVAQGDAALEGSVVDLDVLVAAPVALRAAAAGREMTSTPSMTATSTCSGSMPGDLGRRRGRPADPPSGRRRRAAGTRRAAARAGGTRGLRTAPPSRSRVGRCSFAGACENRSHGRILKVAGRPGSELAMYVWIAAVRLAPASGPARRPAGRRPS